MAAVVAGVTGICPRPWAVLVAAEMVPLILVQQLELLEPMD
jgi:hypothetical protein